MIKLYCKQTFYRSNTDIMYYTKGELYDIIEFESDTSLYVQSNDGTSPCVFTIDTEKEPFLYLYDFFSNSRRS